MANVVANMNVPMNFPVLLPVKKKISLDFENIDDAENLDQIIRDRIISFLNYN